MNRFTHAAYSQLKRSAVVAYLSSADYLRPRYFLLENVGDFINFNGGEVVRLVLRTLLDIGYQVTTAVLQAGQFGVPQSRHRAIILAAAPGYPLPHFPAPLHTFSANALKTKSRMAIGPWAGARAVPGAPYSSVSAAAFPKGSSRPVGSSKDAYAGDIVFTPTAHARTPSAPFRMVKARELFLDLPAVDNACARDPDEGVPYGSIPLTPWEVALRTGPRLPPSAPMTTAVAAGGSSSSGGEGGGSGRGGKSSASSSKGVSGGQSSSSSSSTGGGGGGGGGQWQPGSMVLDHVPKRTNGRVFQRILRVPKYAGADWRDLPNEKVGWWWGVLREGETGENTTECFPCPLFSPPSFSYTSTACCTTRSATLGRTGM